MPLISVIAIILIVSAVVAVSKDRIIESGLFIFLLSHFIMDLAIWWAMLLPKSSGCRYTTAKRSPLKWVCKIQGLGAALAAVHFKMNPLIAVPSAIFSVWHNISGPILAMIFSRMNDDKTTR